MFPGVRAGLAGALLQYDQVELIAQFRLRPHQFFRRSLCGMVKAQTRLHAYDQQIQYIGQAPLDLFLPLGDPAPEPKIRDQEAEPTAAK